MARRRQARAAGIVVEAPICPERSAPTPGSPKTRPASWAGFSSEIWARRKSAAIWVRAKGGDFARRRLLIWVAGERRHVACCSRPPRPAADSDGICRRGQRRQLETAAQDPPPAPAVRPGDGGGGQRGDLGRCQRRDLGGVQRGHLAGREAFDLRRGEGRGLIPRSGRHSAVAVRAPIWVALRAVNLGGGERTQPARPTRPLHTQRWTRAPICIHR